MKHNIKSIVILALMAAFNAAGADTNGTIQNKITPTTQFSREAFTNETAAGWRNKLGVTNSAGGSGSVTSILTGFGLSGGPITNGGTISADSNVLATTTLVTNIFNSITGSVQLLTTNSTLSVTNTVQLTNVLTVAVDHSRTNTWINDGGIQGVPGFTAGGSQTNYSIFSFTADGSVYILAYFSHMTMIQGSGAFDASFEASIASTVDGGESIKNQLLTFNSGSGFSYYLNGSASFPYPGDEINSWGESFPEYVVHNDFVFRPAAGSTVYVTNTYSNSLNGGENEGTNVARYVVFKRGNTEASGVVNVTNAITVQVIGGGGIGGGVPPGVLTNNYTLPVVFGNSLAVGSAVMADASGKISAGSGFSGDGSSLSDLTASSLTPGGIFPVINSLNLTNLNASELRLGTVSDTILPGTITSDITGNAATASLVSSSGNAVLTNDSRNIVFNGTVSGNASGLSNAVDLIAGNSSITIVTNAGKRSFTLTSAGGVTTAAVVAIMSTNNAQTAGNLLAGAAVNPVNGAAITNLSAAAIKGDLSVSNLTAIELNVDNLSLTADGNTNRVSIYGPNGNLTNASLVNLTLNTGVFPATLTASGGTSSSNLWFNVLDYGADSTGATESGEEIQNAINAAGNAGGGVVFFPPGTYSLGSYYDTNYQSEGYYSAMNLWTNNIKLLGSGMHQTKIKWGFALTGSKRNMLASPGKRWSGGWVDHYQTNLWIEGLNLDSENVGNPDVYDTTQIYNVFGYGVVFKDCLIENNPDNDAIDVQFGTDMTVDGCILRNIGGDAIGVQNRHSRVFNTTMDGVGQEAFEFVDSSTHISQVTVINSKNIGFIQSQYFVCENSFLTFTNNAEHGIRIGTTGGSQLTTFKDCTITDSMAGSPGNTAAFFVDHGRTLNLIGCDVLGTLRPSIRATNFARLQVKDCQFGYTKINGNSGGWPAQNNPLIISGGNDAEISGNEFFQTGVSIVATNIQGLNISGNSFRSLGVVASEVTNAVIAGNVFGTSAALKSTNAVTSSYSDNIGGAITLQSPSAVTLSGNTWTSSVHTDYTNAVLLGDSVAAAAPTFSEMRAKLGAVNNPGYGFIGSASGIYSSTANSLFFQTAGGATAWTMSSAGTLFSSGGNQTLLCSLFSVASGSAAAPSIIFGQSTTVDPDSGFFRYGADNIALSTGGTMRWHGTTTNLYIPTLRAAVLRVDSQAAPASATATGVQGEIRWDDSYIYICTATDTWKRAAIAGW